MILTCPSCSARYLIAGDAIGDEGRTVRCGKCGNSWHQAAVRDSLDELSEVDFRDAAENEIVPDFHSDPAPPSFMQENVPPIPAGVRPVSDQPVAGKDKSRKFQLPENLKDHIPAASGAALGFIAFAALIAVVVIARAPIISAMPFTKPIFIALGVEKEGDSRTLVFDSITAKIKGQTLDVTGSLINLSASTMQLPPLVVDILNPAGDTIETLPAQLEQKSLEGEQSIDLKFSYPYVPEEASQARLRFKTADEEEHKEDAPKADASNSHPTTAGEGADNTHAPSEGGSDHPPAHE